jgi:hypothetical protein
MCTVLYAYRFGTISFLDLLDKFEEILQIKLSQARYDTPHAEDRLTADV